MVTGSGGIWPASGISNDVDQDAKLRHGDPGLRSHHLPLRGNLSMAWNVEEGPKKAKRKPPDHGNNPIEGERARTQRQGKKGLR